MLNKKPTGVDALDLENLDDKGKPVETRLRDVKSALSIYATLRKADEKSAVNRARIDAMFDGASPYNEDKLRASGQSLKTNLNFGEAQRFLDISLSAYVDLYSSLETLVEVSGTLGEAAEIQEMESIVAEELTHMMRSWPEFHSSYLRLCTTFIKHGVGVAYFDSPEDWRFRVGGFTDLLIPRQTPSSEDAVDVAVGRRDYLVHELYHFIKNEKAAKAVGWNVDEVKRVIKTNTKTTGRGHMESGSMYTDYEAIQSELKNNDLYTGIQNPKVPVLHFWVREMDGTVSHYICAEDSPKDFLYKKISRFSSPEQAYVMFTYGVGSNGTYHSIRGLGQRIFSHIQTSNRLRCQLVDGAMLGSAVMIQPESQRALDELQFTYYGAYAILSPGVNIVEKAIPNLGNAVVPALNDLTAQLQQNTDTVSTYGPGQSSPYRNQMQIASDIDINTRISGASLNLFYSSWTRLMREIVRRVTTSKKSDPAVKEFFRRCTERGVDEKFVRNLDLTKTRAVRSVGNGSKAGRLVALRELQGMYGRLDEVGRRNLDRDVISSSVGHEIANRYLPATTEPRTTVDNKIAFLENQQLNQGSPVPVLSTEMHGTHLQTHVPALAQLIEALNTGQADPMQAIDTLQAFYRHISETLQFAAADPSLEADVASAKQVMQYAEEAINNTMKSIQKQQRDATKQEGGPQEGSQVLTPSEMKMQQAQIQMQIAQMKAEQEMELKQKKFDQEQAMRDAEAALKFREENPI
tara:strand:- start:6885 stop:9125 length:2241 start_codon:yes stop_codon:yes gene_type:complete